MLYNIMLQKDSQKRVTQHKNCYCEGAGKAVILQP